MLSFAGGGIKGRASFDSMPSWSPDGRSIAFVRASAPGAAVAFIQRIGTDGRQLTRLTEGGIFDFSPAWSPDGSRIAFMRTGGALPGRDSVTIGDANLGFVPASGGRPSGVNVFGRDAAWSPDGRRVAFVNYRDMNGLTCFAHGNLGRYVLGLDAARTHAGQRCFANGEIYVADNDGRNARRLTSSLADDSHPSWSPDGSRIVFSSGFHAAGRPLPKLYVIPASGCEASLLFSPARGAALDPAWAPS